MCGSLQQGNGFYSSYFIVPKKDVGLCRILDLRVLNDSVMQLKFKMLTLRQILPEIRSEDWFFTIDLKDAYTFKTKELIVDLQKKIDSVPALLYINGEGVKRVETFKYLGVLICNDLSWAANTTAIVK